MTRIALSILLLAACNGDDFSITDSSRSPWPGSSSMGHATGSSSSSTSSHGTSGETIGETTDAMGGLGCAKIRGFKANPTAADPSSPGRWVAVDALDCGADKQGRTIEWVQGADVYPAGIQTDAGPSCSVMLGPDEEGIFAVDWCVVLRFNGATEDEVCNVKYGIEPGSGLEWRLEGGEWVEYLPGLPGCNG